LDPLATIPTLRVVLAANCPNIEDANPLRYVSSADLSGCERLRHIERLRELTQLDVRDCPLLPEHIVRRIMRNSAISIYF
jgi:hypothetical protein